MLLAAIKPAVAALLNASAALRPFGEASVFSWMDDDETRRNEIATAIKTNGAYLEVWMGKPVRVNGVMDRPLSIEVPTIVFVGESKETAHNPSEDALIDAVIAALQPTGAQQPFVRFTDCESETTEDGFVLHTVHFTIRFGYG